MEIFVGYAVRIPLWMGGDERGDAKLKNAFHPRMS